MCSNLLTELGPRKSILLTQTSRPHIMSEGDPEILLAKREAAEMEANPTLLQQYAMAHDIS